MAVTHADLAPGPRCSDLGSKTGGFLMLLSILCGLGTFILCLIAETTRSQVSWILASFNDGESERYECMYSGSGKIPLLCAVGAFLGLAIAMIMEHAYMLVAVNKTSPPALIAWNPNDSSSLKTLAYIAGFFFVTTWICFAIAEVLLIIGLGVEAGHLKNWWKPRPNCLIARQGMFLAAGIFGLTSVFLVSGLYLTALRAQKLRELQENVLREVLDTSMLFASPPRSPRHVLMANDLVENSHFTQELNDHRPPRREMQAFSKPVSSNELNSLLNV